MRGIAVLSAILGLVFIVPANAKSATTSKSKNEHSLSQIIQWEKAQIKNQRKIIKERMLWRTLTSESIRMVFLTDHGVKAHKLYLRKLQVRLAANIKEYKRSIQHGVSPRLSAWICIHGYEGAWNANTGNGYYGGLQMDFGFQQTYGPELFKSKGTANNWTPKEQIMVADRAYAKRGFYPWPNTARYCGLL